MNELKGSFISRCVSYHINPFFWINRISFFFLLWKIFWQLGQLKFYHLLSNHYSHCRTRSHKNRLSTGEPRRKISLNRFALFIALRRKRMLFCRFLIGITYLGNFGKRNRRWSAYCHRSEARLRRFGHKLFHLSLRKHKTHCGLAEVHCSCPNNGWELYFLIILFVCYYRFEYRSVS